MALQKLHGSRHHFTHFYAFPVWYFLLSGIPSFSLLFFFIHRPRAHHHPVMVFSSPFYFPTMILISILSILVVSAISSMITKFFLTSFFHLFCILFRPSRLCSLWGCVGLRSLCPTIICRTAASHASYLQYLLVVYLSLFDLFHLRVSSVCPCQQKLELPLRDG
jgi:hypothetical protein